MSTAFLCFATLTISTKRSPAVTGGKRGTPTTFLTGVKAMPLDPVSPELRQRLALNTPHELLQTYVLGTQDIREGDFVVSGTQEYPVRSVAEWPSSDGVLRHLILEDLKR